MTGTNPPLPSASHAPLPPMLADLRIVAVEQYGAGPFATMFLADLGAEVIKIENPADGGDVGRTVGPHFHPDLPREQGSYFFQGFNRGKKSVTLDLARPEGRSVFRRLVSTADAVFHNLRGDVPAKLGLTYADLADANPRIVCAHLTAYGRTGERAKWPGYDFLMQGEAGYFHLTGEPEGAPVRMGLSLVDQMTGIALGSGLLAGIHAAKRDGRGRDVDMSLFDLALSNLTYVAHWYLNAGAVTGRQPRSAHASLTPCQSYRTKDGWIFLMCNKEKFYPELCRRIGRPELAEDPRFLRFPDRLANRDELTRVLDAALMTRTTDEWLREFAGAVPASPIYDVKQALDNPYVAGSNRMESIPVAGSATPVKLLTHPLRSEGLPRPGTLAPRLGEHTDSLLASVGYTAEQIATLRGAGIV